MQGGMETQHIKKVAHQKQVLVETRGKIQQMESIRLELIPIVLEAVEQVKTGELAPREFNNACGRARVRLEKLQELESEVKTVLESMEVPLSVSEETKIEIKRNSLTEFLNKCSTTTS